MAGFSTQRVTGMKSRCWPELPSHLGLRSSLKLTDCWQNSVPCSQGTEVRVFFPTIVWGPLAAPRDTHSSFLPCAPVISSESGGLLSAGQVEYISLTSFLTNERKLSIFKELQ